MRGGSQANLVLADDGCFYVVKVQDNLQGPNLLFNESAGYELYRSFGLKTPNWQTLQLSESFIEKNRAFWIHDLHDSRPPKPGLCFGSQFLGLEGIRTLEILPARSHKLIQNRADFWLAWVIDACAEHADNRQALFTEDTNSLLYATFLDHGSMFRGADGKSRHNIRASRYLDHRIYPDLTLMQQREIESHFANLDTEALLERIKALPEAWKTSSALQNFEQTLNCLSSGTLVRNLLQTMFDIARVGLKLADRSARGFPEIESELRPEVLHPRILRPEFLHPTVNPALRKGPRSAGGRYHPGRDQRLAG